MRWTYTLPAPLGGPDDRTALEDLYLRPEDGSSGRESYWFTLEALQSFTGGTRDEKLQRLGDREFVISDHMDMLVRQDDFDRRELLEWTKTFIRARFGDPDPILVEDEGEEARLRTPTTTDRQSHRRRRTRAKLLFVHHKAGPPSPFPEEMLAGDPRAEVRSVCVADDAAAGLPTSLFQWADLVVVMEKRMRHFAYKRMRALGVNKRIICLHLPEHHDARDPQYQALFMERIGVYLEKLDWGGA